MKRKTFCFFLLCLLSSLPQVNAQDTIAAKKNLDSVTIVAVRTLAADPGMDIKKPDSIQYAHYVTGTLSDLLGQNGILLLKTYGGGGLSTTSIRGASASQTPVFW